MKCDETKLWMADYWNGTLGEAEEVAFESHLSICENCRAEADRLGAMWKGLALLPVEEPSEVVRGRFYDTLAAYRQGVESVPKPKWKEKVLSWWPQQPAWQMAAAAATLIIGVAVGYGVKPGEPQQQVKELREEVSEMRQLVALSLLQQQSASERLRGVSWAYRSEPSNSEVLSALVMAVRSDPNVNVRMAAVEALKPFAQSPPQNQMALRAIREALPREDSPLVQGSLIDFLVDLKDREAVGQLRQIAAAESVDVAVKERAQWALGELQ